MDKSTEDLEEPVEKEEQQEKKTRKLGKKDWDSVQEFVQKELDERKRNPFRKAHEKIWAAVDRQVNMQPLKKMDRNNREVDAGWHSVIELGELSKASENMSADVRRILFPQSRYWFDPHSDLSFVVEFNEDGEKPIDQKLQDQVDGRLRAMMMQQHLDFGLKNRFELSVKEALHHGSFVAETDWDTMEMIYGGTKVTLKGAPVWKPHSMWNCYPDSSPSVIGANLFYDGSMIIVTYKNRAQCEKDIFSGEDGWLPKKWKDVPKEEHKIKKGDETSTTKDVEITTYTGDVIIGRGDEDLPYPNHKVILFNGVIVYMAPNQTPYPPIIMGGYERMDVRDPYYMSPLIKMSPMQTLGSQLANKTMDGIELQLEPPIVYDGNDPDFVLNGGPNIAPGAKTSTKGSATFKQIEIGDVSSALRGLEFVLGEMKAKLGRPGKPVGDRATKAEVVKAAQDAEVSLVDFIDKLEGSLRSFLYMQHGMNLERMQSYSFYSPEMLDSDYITVQKRDLPKVVNFEVVGSRGVLGEQERSEKMTIVTGFASQNPLFAPLLKPEEILIQMYQDAGVKNAERFLKLEEEDPIPPEVKNQLEQAKKAIQVLGEKLQQEQSGTQAKLAKAQMDNETKLKKIEADNETKRMAIEAKFLEAQAKLEANMKQHMDTMLQEQKKHVDKIMHEQALQFSQQNHEKNMTIVVGGAKRKISKNGDGTYTAEDVS